MVSIRCFLTCLLFVSVASRATLAVDNEKPIPSQKVQNALADKNTSLTVVIGNGFRAYHVGKSTWRPMIAKDQFKRPDTLSQLVADRDVLDAIGLSEDQSLEWKLHREAATLERIEHFRGRKASANDVRRYYAMQSRKTEKAIREIFLPVQVDLLNEMKHQNRIYNEGLKAINDPDIASKIGLLEVEKQQVLELAKSREKELAKKIAEVVGRHYAKIFEDSLTPSKAELAKKLIPKVSGEEGQQ